MPRMHSVIKSIFSFSPHFFSLKGHTKIDAALILSADNDEEEIRRLYCTSGSRGGRWLLRLLLYYF